ncbi:STAS domain-containing protein [Deinococcus sp.]|uniref:STAS domain-containing protein n=1 Tax=Deinococcus sp. TaxID=47478 RepID=UPI003C7B1ADD
MQISKVSDRHLLVCRLEGRLDAYQVPRLKEALEPLDRALHLDLSGVSFIDSSGLAALIGLYKRAREIGVGFELSGIQDGVRLILEITGLERILPIRAGAAPRPSASGEG